MVQMALRTGTKAVREREEDRRRRSNPNQRIVKPVWVHERSGGRQVKRRVRFYAHGALNKTAGKNGRGTCRRHWKGQWQGMVRLRGRYGTSYKITEREREC